jgi:hypothetical protein
VRAADDDPRSALPGIEAAAELATAHGQTEQLGWCHYSRCEALWVIGDWDAAIQAGLAAVALGDRYSYERLAYRTWVVLLPMAAARRDATLAADWERWWAVVADGLPSTPSPYARMLNGAISVWVAQATGREAPSPPDDLVDAVIPMGNPHFVAGIETVAQAWLDAGRGELVARAAATSASMAAEPDSTRLMRASAALLDAWVTGSQEAARACLQLAREHGAPWWELRALRALGDPSAEPIAAALGIGPS